MDSKQFEIEYIRCPDMEEIVEYEIFCTACKNFNGLRKMQYGGHYRKAVSCSLADSYIPFK